MILHVGLLSQELRSISKIVVLVKSNINIYKLY
jgi:hypothetical protein